MKSRFDLNDWVMLIAFTIVGAIVLGFGLLLIAHAIAIGAVKVLIIGVASGFGFGIIVFLPMYLDTRNN